MLVQCIRNFMGVENLQCTAELPNSCPPFGESACFLYLPLKEVAEIFKTQCVGVSGDKLEIYYQFSSGGSNNCEVQITDFTIVKAMVVDLDGEAFVKILISYSDCRLLDTFMPVEMINEESGIVETDLQMTILGPDDLHKKSVGPRIFIRDCGWLTNPEEAIVKHLETKKHMGDKI